MLKKFPFKDNSIEFIYTSHFLEHLYAKELEKLLDECFRILKPGSKISVAVPNARLYIDAYINRKPFVTYEEMFVGGKVNSNSMIDQINYIAYLGGDHKGMFDEESLVNILIKHGFSDAKLREFDPRFDKDFRDAESIYAEGTKEEI